MEVWVPSTPTCQATPLRRDDVHKQTDSAGEAECFHHRRNGHQLGVAGRQMHHDRRVTIPTAIEHYLSEQWFI